MSYDSTIWFSPNADSMWLRFCFAWILVSSAVTIHSWSNNIIRIPDTTGNSFLCLSILRSNNHRYLSSTFCFYYLLSKIQEICYNHCSSFFFFFKLSLWFRDVFHFALTHTVLSLSPCKNIILKCAIWASSKMLFSNGQLSFSCFYLHFLQLIISILFSALLNCPFQPPENMNSWLNSQ